MTLSPKSLAGPGYIILNAIRVMNIIAFLAVIAASVVMLVKTSTASKFFFFDAVSHVVTAVISMFLIASEVSLFRAFFARNWPLLSPAHGFVALGAAMVVLGVNVLGNLNKPAASQEALGLEIWRIVIGSGIIVFILGFFNLAASYIFRDNKQDITARQVRAQGAVAVHKKPMSTSSIRSAPTMQSMSPSTPAKRFSKAFHRMSRSNTMPTLPLYTKSPEVATMPVASPEQPQPSPSSKYSRATCDTAKKLFGGSRKRESVGPSLPINISAPMNVNPQFAHLVQRPDSALHPSRTGESDTQRWKI
ncbi:hypothetical protein AAFC00_003188 [Neodothiora populina]|uniref:DUF7598 domain-containing protein n=1 Tax=Neodothiora populina TaxID=2781224 RepID=A0ABR3PAB4_9PEZI